MPSERRLQQVELVVLGFASGTVDPQLLKTVEDALHWIYMISPIGFVIYIALSKLAHATRLALFVGSFAASVGLTIGVGGYVAFAVLQAVLAIGCAFTLRPCMEAAFGADGLLLLFVTYIVIVLSCLCWGAPKVVRDFHRSIKLIVGSEVSPRGASEPSTPREPRTKSQTKALSEAQPEPDPEPEASPRTKQMQQLFYSFDTTGWSH